MNDVGGSEGGTGLRATKPSRSSDTNFEYDDSEWDVGIGNLIIDLDADIEKNNEASRSGTAVTSKSVSDDNVATTTTSSSQMHVPQSSSLSAKTSKPSASNKTDNSSSNMEHSAVVDKGLKMKIKRTKTSKSGADAKHEIVKSDLGATVASGVSVTSKSSNEFPTGKVTGHPSVTLKDKDKSKDGGTKSDLDKDATNVSSTNSSVNGSGNGNKDKESSNSEAASGSKMKTQRKTSTHHNKKDKKSTSTTPSSSSSNKKDEKTNSPTLSDSKPLNPGVSSSHTVNLNVPSVMSSGSSAFAKTSAAIKVPSASTVAATSLSNPLMLHTATDASNHRSPNTTLTPTSWTSSSSIKTSTDKTFLSIANLGSNLNSTMEKSGRTSPSYLKKSRLFSQIEKGQSSVEDAVSSKSTANESNESSIPSTLSGPNLLALSGITLTAKDLKTKGTGKSQDVCVGTSVGTVTDPDCLGPCEPGTSVTLEGIVWHETEGVLVVNVTWRGKTYVGTLLDCTKNDWAPPRFCDSPSSDIEMRTPKNRAKRGRAQTATPVNEIASQDLKSGNVKLRNGAKGRRGSSANGATSFVAPASPIKPEPWPKRKTRGSENESQEDTSSSKNTKRPKVKETDKRERQSNSPAPNSDSTGPYSPALIECPEPNCSKKYKHINGLRYHQSHAHSNTFNPEDSDSNMSTATEPTNLGNDATVDGTLDVSDNAEIASGTTIMDFDELSSSPVKKPVATPSFTGVKEKITDGDSESDLNGAKDTESEPMDITSPISNKSGSGKLLKLTDGDNVKSNATNAGGPNRTPILTVPVPYLSLSLQNRQYNPVVNVPRIDSVREQDGNSGKGSSSGSSNNGKSGTWTTSSGTTGQNSGSQSVCVPLNVPGNLLESSRKDREKSPSSSSKKLKHKKKSKDKDRDRDDSCDDRASSSSNVRNPDFRQIGDGKSCDGSKNKHSGKTGTDELTIDSRDSMTEDKSDNPRNSENDRQSPAYSDISDANESGPETEINIGGVKDCCSPASIGLSKDSKKDSLPPGGSGTGSSGMPPYYSNFFSPYLETPSSGSTVASGAAIGPSVAEDSRRSPKLDFHHSKFMPQQNFFPYQYPNYPYDQPPYAVHGTEDRDKSTRETGVESRLQKNRSDNNRKDDASSTASTIKSEPEENVSGDAGGSSGFPMHIDDKVIVKTEGGIDLSSEPRPHSHLHPSAKMSKDSKRTDRDERGERLQGSSESNRSDNYRTSSGRSSTGSISDRKTPGNSDDKDGKREREKNEGVKPTMQTQGPPPPPTAGSYAYLPQSYLPGNPYGLPYDPTHPLYRQMLVSSGAYPGAPYMHPSQMGRFPPSSTPLPEDLSRPTPTVPTSKDMLHHAAQYYGGGHKIHELQERALKSPTSNPQVSAAASRERDLPPAAQNLSSTPSSPGGVSNISAAGSSGRSSVGSNAGGNNMSKATDLSKDCKPNLPISAGSSSDNSRTPPPTQHHVHSHTHHHTHVGIGYPIIPTVPPQYSPHYGVIPTPPSAPPSVIPSFPSQKPN